MSVFFSTESTDENSQLATLWRFLETENFDEAANLAEAVCQDSQAPIEFFCGLSLAYGELGFYAESEQVARQAVGFGESHWRPRHALAVSLMHQGRFLAAVDALGFYRDPLEIYVVRAQIEKMGRFWDGLQITLEDALERSVPPHIRLYLAYLYSTLADDIPEWPGRNAGFDEVIRLGDHLGAWERDIARHHNTVYGQTLQQHVNTILHWLTQA